MGAIARGKQAIIVGDPKQLPPTSFFQRVDEADEEEPIETENIEDLESILDDCISARLPWLPLNWHYRSRDETLIAFSNYHYYGNRLLTFPSAYREGLGVKWHHVPSGVYDRGKSATNHAEAEAIVKEILRRLKDKSLSQWSIGVVTFSQAQQALIENLLENARQNDPDVDQFFSEEARERVFVKNLENVQGDERDVILFSICYGPDSLGRVSMNFGPMNREGGERRLNVAITRARREVIIYSTLRADQIDLSRSRARGVRDLKNFLEYAERGPSAIAEATRFDAEADFDSPFEKAIYDILVGKGWEIHKQVGCARYRIDLAVVDPEVPGRYLLGIECDGANYHRAKTARDRDKLRQAILQDLGWKLYRIWSTDWWTNPAQEIRKLDAAIDKAKTSWCQERLTPGALQAQPKSDSQISLMSNPAVQSKHQEATSLVSSETTVPVYRPYAQKKTVGAREDFYSSSSIRVIRQLIVAVVEHEGPVSLGLATRRITAHWGYERIAEKSMEQVRTLVPLDKIQIHSSGGGFFLWAKGVCPETYEGFRVPSPDNPESLREAKDLPVEEIANAVLYLLQQHISVPYDAIVRETSRLFGFQRAGKQLEDRMSAGIDCLIARGTARREGEQIIFHQREAGRTS